MDHSEAVRLHAAEYYLLGELSSAQRDEFEEHYFDCPECAEELKVTAAFMESAKQVVRQKTVEPIDHKGFVPANGGWLAWLKPAVAIPVFAALLVLVGYQNGVTIPRLKRTSSSQSTQIMSSSFHLAGSVRGGSEAAEGSPKLQVHPGEGFLLDFDFTPSHSATAYRWQLLGPAGRIVKEGVLGGDKTNQAAHLPVGGVERSGKYDLVFFDAGASAQTTSENEVQRFTFTVEFLY